MQAGDRRRRASTSPTSDRRRANEEFVREKVSRRRTRREGAQRALLEINRYNDSTASLTKNPHASLRSVPRVGISVRRFRRGRDRARGLRLADEASQPRRRRASSSAKIFAASDLRCAACSSRRRCPPLQERLLRPPRPRLSSVPGLLARVVGVTVLAPRLVVAVVRRPSRRRSTPASARSPLRVLRRVPRRRPARRRPQPALRASSSRPLFLSPPPPPRASRAARACACPP